MANDNKSVEGSRLLSAVQAVAISPDSAAEMVQKYQAKLRESNPGASKKWIQEGVADKIVSRYTWLSTTSGGISALPGIIPGAGTAVVVGTALGDATLCMKFQVDMCLCLAAAFDYDIQTEDAQHLAFLIAAGGALEKAGGDAAVKIATKAGVKMVRQYLKGAILQAVKQFFRRLGIVFTRKALEKAIPFGVGVVVGAGGNYAMTKYVGYQAKKWFMIDRDDVELDGNIVEGTLENEPAI